MAMRLFKGFEGTWNIRYTGKNEAEVRRLFDTDILPTCYRNTVPAVRVLEGLHKLNPDRTVELIPTVR